MVVENPRDPATPASEITQQQYAISIYDTGVRTDFSPECAEAACLSALESGRPVDVVLSCPFAGSSRQVVRSRRVSSAEDLAPALESAQADGCRITGVRVAGTMVVLDRAGLAYAQALVDGQVRYYECGQGAGLAGLLAGLA
jgi:hypothetical protein